MSEFARFVVAGGIAALVNVVCRYLFDLAVPYEIAIVLAYLCGMMTAFVLSKRFVFARSQLRTHEEFVRFALVNLLALAQVWIISVGLARWLFPLVGFDFHPDTVAHIVGVIAPVFTSYLGHKRFSFSPGSRRA